MIIYTSCDDTAIASYSASWYNTVVTYYTSHHDQGWDDQTCHHDLDCKFNCSKNFIFSHVWQLRIAIFLP